MLHRVLHHHAAVRRAPCRCSQGRTGRHFSSSCALFAASSAAISCRRAASAFDLATASAKSGTGGRLGSGFTNLQAGAQLRSTGSGAALLCWVPACCTAMPQRVTVSTLAVRRSLLWTAPTVKPCRAYCWQIQLAGDWPRRSSADTRPPSSTQSSWCTARGFGSRWSMYSTSKVCKVIRFSSFSIKISSIFDIMGAVLSGNFTAHLPPTLLVQCERLSFCFEFGQRDGEGSPDGWGLCTPHPPGDPITMQLQFAYYI